MKLNVSKHNLNIAAFSLLPFIFFYYPLFSQNKVDNKFDQGIKKIETHSCNACHSLYTKERIVGPGFKNLFNSVRPMSNGTKINADKQYLKDAISVYDRLYVMGYPEKIHPKYDFSAEDLELIVYTLSKL